MIGIAMMGLANLRSLNLVLTARCNMRCAYCYQNAKKNARMSWDTLRTALDLARASARGDVGVHFLGGEPCLEFPMMRRAVRYLEERRPPGRRYDYGISTNGTLLTEEMCVFLDERRFETQLSFDGVPGAQDERQPGSFDALDGLLDRLRDRYPGFFRWRVKIAITVSPESIPYLADSVEYFLGKGVRQIVMMPSIIAGSSWELERIAEIDAQFARIHQSSLRHYREAREIPVAVFQNKYDDECAPRREDMMCGVPLGGAIVVDVDGEASGCTVHALSYQNVESPFLRNALRRMAMGPIDDAGFAERYAAFPEAARETGLFHNKRRKHSAYGRCGECPYAGDCSICPTSIGHIAGNADPDRVPDFACAYNRVSLKYRALFPARPRPQELLRGPAGIAAEMERWRTLAGAARRERVRAS